MGHTKPEELKDLAKELTAIAALEGMKQKSVGVFYWKSVPFLHFHTGPDGRVADIKKVMGGWSRVSIDRDASAAARGKFLREVKAAHAKFLRE